MPKRSRTIEVVVGVFVLAALVLFLIMVVLIGRRQNIFESRYEISGVYKSVAGLQPGAEVHLAGINIGYVKSIRFSSANEIEVLMTISKAQSGRIREDSIACIRTMGLMGDRYIQITVGSEGQKVIPPGGRILTSEIIEWEEMLESARPTLSNIENAVRNISEITDGLAAPDGNVDEILTNIKTLTSDARDGRGTIGALLTRDDIYNKTSEVLDTARITMENLKEVSNNTRAASTKFPGILEEAQSGVGKFAEFSALATQTATGIYNIVGAGEEAMKNIEAMTSNLKTASQDIADATPRMGALIDSADEGVSETRKVVDAAKRSWLIRGYLQPPVPGEPIVLSGRDVAQPEVAE